MKILILIVIPVLMGFGLSAQENESAIVSFLVGKVSIKSSGNIKWRALKKEDKVVNGDTVITEKGSVTTLSYKNSEFKISANSTLLINGLHSKEKDGSVEVKNGSVWFKIVDLGDKKFSATTPISVAGVRGTAFATLYDEKSKTGMNCVCDGKVEVTSTEKGALPKLIEKGNGSSLKKGSAEINVGSYEGLISKMESLPAFEAKVKESPMFKNCLSCHTPKGWTIQGILKDDKYGNSEKDDNYDNQ